MFTRWKFQIAVIYAVLNRQAWSQRGLEHPEEPRKDERADPTGRT